ncbi:MAG: hypothetical protein PHS41_00875 [Victivallaceae bacterium]|nr:hypothetical protein [Victivallaceae bacterium]
MYSSKLVAVVASLTALALAAAVAFQVLEIKDYNLFETLQARFGKAKSVETSAPAAATATEAEKPAPEAPASK